MAQELFYHTVERDVNVLTLHLPEAVDVVEFDRINESILKLMDGRTKQRWLIDLSPGRRSDPSTLRAGLMMRSSTMVCKEAPGAGDGLSLTDEGIGNRE